MNAKQRELIVSIYESVIMNELQEIESKIRWLRKTDAKLDALCKEKQEEIFTDGDPDYLKTLNR